MILYIGENECRLTHASKWAVACDIFVLIDDLVDKVTEETVVYGSSHFQYHHAVVQPGHQQ